MAVRYPRGTGPGVAVQSAMTARPGAVAGASPRVACQPASPSSPSAPCWRHLATGEDLDATVVNMRFVKPLDEALLRELAMSHDLLVTVEENVVAGWADRRRLRGIPGGCGNRSADPAPGAADRFIDHGDPAKLLAASGAGRRRHRGEHPRGCRTCPGNDENPA